TFIQAEEITVSGDTSSGQMSFQFGPSYVKKDVKPMNDKTIEELRGIAHAATVYPKISLSGEIVVGSANAIFFSSAQPPVAFASASPADQVGFGRFLQTDDEQSVVIPAAMATALGFTDPLQAVGREAVLKNFNVGGRSEMPNGETQRTVTQKDITVTIVGVYKEGGSSAASFQAAIPSGTATSILKELYSTELSKAAPSLYDSITVRADESANVTAVKDAIVAKGYGAETLGDIVKSIAKVYAIMKAVLGVLGGIALLVASLGVANTMFMAVLERTKEIGILKALGARDWDVRKLFTYEAAVIGFFGGVVGLLFGYGGTTIIGQLVSYYTNKSGGGDFLTVGVPMWLAAGAIVFSILFASIAGFFPARRAARLDPVVALREE
ncbi:MAG: FtsX-like permease family protein, partial [Parcubacteria group bacterium]